MTRRAFIGLLGGGVAWPLAAMLLAARAQQRPVPVIGLLSGADLDDRQLDAIRHGLGESGYAVGKDVAIEYRSVAGEYARLPALASELVRRDVAAIVALGVPAGLAAKAATATIPIVLGIGDDPVRLGLVASLNRPGGNVTGVTFLVNALGAKRLGLLRELLPNAAAVGELINPAYPNAAAETSDLQEAARALGLRFHTASASSGSEIEAAFGSLMQQRIDALVIGADAFFFAERDRLIALAARHALPTMYFLRVFAVAGGLLSYGTSDADAMRQTGLYAARILKGEKPADLPVVQSTRFELVINLKTARALGLTLPLTLQAAADEVIE
jgi:putative ABC transport system substrate-binding protein